MNIHRKEAMYTLQLINTVLFKPVYLLFLYFNHMLKHSGCDAILKKCYGAHYPT